VATSSGNWNVGSNWSTGTVPGPSDDAVINPSAALTVAIDSGEQSVHSLEGGTNATLDLSGGSLAVAAGAEIDGGFQINGDVTLAGTFHGGAGAASQLESGSLTTGSSGATLDFPQFQWAAGTIDGVVTNAGTLNAAGGGSKFLAGTLTNTGTIDVTGAGGIYAEAANTTINNPAGATFDFQVDTSLNYNGYTTAFNNAGTLEKTAGTGTSYLTFPLADSGTAEADAGTLRLPSSGSGSDAVINANGTGIVAWSGTYSGSFSGSGSGAVQMSGLTASGSGGVTLNFTGTVLQWLGAISGTFTNAGTLNAAGGGNKVLAGTLTNTDTIDVTGTGGIYAVAPNTTINNQAGATFDFQGDGSLNYNGYTTAFNNAGTLEKTGTTGTTSINFALNDTGGTVSNASAGTLDFSGGGTITGSMTVSGAVGITGGWFSVADGSTIGAPSGGIGSVQLAGGTVSLAGSLSSTILTVGGGTLTGSGTLASGSAITWSGGTIAGGLTNAGTLNVAGTGNMLLAGTLTNAGTIDVTGTGGIYAEAANTTINNQAGATFDFQADTSLNYNGYTTAFYNAGTLEKTAGTGTSYLTFPLADSGTAEVDSGTLSLPETGSGSDAVINANGTGIVAWSGTYSGSFSGSGSGAVQMAGLTASGSDGVTLNFTGAVLQWLGAISGTFTNAGTLNAAGGGNKVLAGTLTNTGTIDVTGTGGIYAVAPNATINNQAGATFDFQDDGSLQFNGYTTAFNNAGTLEKTGGTGTSFVSFDLNNPGSVEAGSGTLWVDSSVAQIFGLSLTGGTWGVFAGSTLRISTAGNITTSAANITLSGPGATFALINKLATSTGSFDVLGGASFTTAGDFSNQGSLGIGARSTLNVSGSFTQSSTASIGIQIGGTPGSGQFGQVVASGSAALDGALSVSLVNGYGPTAGDHFQVMSYASRTGDFASVSGLTAGRTQLLEEVTSDTNVAVNSLANAADLAVQSVTAPDTGTPGQVVTINYTVSNNQPTPTSANAWVDSIYLSRSDHYDSSAELIGRVQHTGAVAGNGSYSGTLTAPLPGVVPGNYRILVIVDSEGFVPDINRANNTLAAPNLVSMSMASLTPGVTASGTIDNGQDEYYQVNLPAGPVTTITANFAAAAGGEMFVRYQNVPDQATFDQMAFDPKQSQQQIVLNGTQAGSYYILVHGREGSAGGKPFSILVQEIGFQIVSVSPAQGSNSGQVTLTISGSQLTPSTAVSLVAGNGVLTSASDVLFKDNATLFATFDLTGLNSGSYGVQIAGAGQMFTDPGAFTVTSGAPGQVTLNLSCSTFTNNNNPGTIVITYSNVGGTDAPAPLMVLSSDNASFELPGSTTYVPNSVNLLGINETGPAGTLPPGYQGTITLSFLPIDQSPHALSNFALTAIPSADSTFDWSSIAADLQPPNVPNDAWAAIYQNFTAAVGSTLGQFQQALDKDATYLSQLGVYTVDVSRLFSFELQKADDFGAISRRYTLGAFGRGWPDPTAVKAMTDSSGNVTIEYSGRVRTFFIQPNGTYQGVPGDAATVSLQNGVYTLRETDGSLAVFNPDGTLNYIEDTNGNKITANYTGGLLTSFVDATRDTVAFAYNAQGRITQVTDPVGRVSTYSYDPTGQLLLSVTDPTGTTSYTYVTDQGAPRQYALVSITRPDGSQTLFNYDAQGRLVSQEADLAGDEKVTYAYDGEGGISVTDAGGGTSTYFVNEYEQIGAYEDPLGRFTHFIYDANHNLINETGPDGITTTFTKNAAGDTTSTTDPSGNGISAAYDPSFNKLTSLTDPNGNTTNFSHDPNGNLLAITYPDSSQEQFSYDPTGNLVESIDCNGTAIGYKYDTHNLFIEEDLADGSKITFAYDSHRNLISAANSAGTTSFQYDPADRLTQVTYPNGMYLKFTYDAAGQRTRMVDQTGFTVDYQYDGVGRLSGLTDGNGNLIVEYTYNAAGRLARKDMGNGTYTKYGYDLAGDLSSIANYKPDGTVLSSYFYAYDDLGRPISLTTLAGTTTYGYDPTGQLTSVSLPGGRTISYQYDPAGNRVSVTDSGVTTHYTANNLNEYTQVGSTEYAYDKDGNLVSSTNSSGTTSYAYNQLGQLVSIGSPQGTWTYQYDALGNRIAETQNGQVTQYLIDPAGFGSVVGEYDGSGTLVAHYTQGLGLTSRVDASGSATYYNFDLTGDTTELIAADGTVQNSYSYLPFGETLSATGTSPNPFVYVGELGATSDKSGVFYMRRRWYDPPTGRFLSNDPIGFFGGDINSRRYVYNAPTALTDASGLRFDFGPFATGSDQAVAGGARLFTAGGDKFLVDVAGGPADVLAKPSTKATLAAEESAAVNRDALHPQNDGHSPLGPFGMFAVSLPPMSCWCGDKMTPQGFEHHGEAASLVDSNPPHPEDIQGLTGIKATVQLPTNVGIHGGDNAFFIDYVGIKGNGGSLEAGVSYPKDGKWNEFINGGTAWGSTGQLLQNGPGFGSLVTIQLTFTTNGQGTVAVLTVSNGAVQDSVAWPIPVNNFTPTAAEIVTSVGNDTEVSYSLTELTHVEFNYDNKVDQNGNLVWKPANPNNFQRERQVGDQVQNPDIYCDSGANWLKSYLPFPSPFLPANCIMAHSSHLRNGDPNNLIGPAGFGTGGFITPGLTLPYTILFANESTADIPVQKVVVTERVGPSLDWTTFAVGDFTIGGTTYAVPPNHGSYSTQLDLTSTLGIYLDVTAGINLATGVATWTFTSVDPTTGDLPSNIFTGFLPPDKNPPEGEASVNYTIRPKVGLATGTQITAQATVVFDTNAPLSTPQALNTIDSSTPTSSVNPLPPAEWATSFPVSWSGSDGAGSGIAGYDVYVSADGGQFSMWQAGTTATAATFDGQLGHVYSFYSVATSNVGFVETTPSGAQATTRIVPLVTVTSLTPETIKVGNGKKGKKQTVVVLEFSGALNVTAADNVSAYQLAPIIKVPGKGKGKHRKPPTTKLGPPVPLASAVYSAANDSVTLIPRGKLKLPEQLTVFGALVSDAAGLPIDGMDDGQPGSNYVAVISKSGVSVGAAVAAQTRPPHPPSGHLVPGGRRGAAAAAVDALLEQNNGDAFSVKDVARSERQFRDDPPADHRRATRDEALLRMLQIRVESERELPGWPEWMPAADRFAVPLGPAPQTAGNWNPESTGLPGPGSRSEGSAESRKRDRP
jgi:RHS repeat-associated protein